MGNLFSGSNTTNLLSKSSLNIKDIQDLKTQLGNTSTHHYQNNPKELGELFEGSQVDISLFSVEEGKEDYLNTFLEGIRNNINGLGFFVFCFSYNARCVACINFSWS